MSEQLIHGDPDYYTELRATIPEFHHALDVALAADPRLTWYLLDKWGIIHGDHTCYFPEGSCGPFDHRHARAVILQQVAPAPPATYPAGTRGVERWRTLVSEYFPAGEVNRALRVMRCESGGDPGAKNRRSSAAGLFQFLRSTWNRVAAPLGLGTYESGAVYHGESNIKAAAALWGETRTWRPWSCQP